MALTAAQAINQQTDTGIPGVVNRQTQLGDFGSLTGMTPAPAPRMTQPAAPAAPLLPMPQRAQQSIVQGQQEAAGIQAQQQAEAERNLSVQQRGLERIAQGEMGIKKDYAKSAGQALEAATPAEAPTFQPSRDDVTNLMGLFGLVTAVGFASAGEGRYSAINALSNMEGMMKGYNKGRADLFTQESTEFEKNLRKVAADNQALKDRLERSLQMFAVNRDAALAELEPIKADLKGSALEYDIRQGNFKTALDRINKNIDNAQKVLDRWEESKQRFAERQILQGQMLEGRKDLAAFAASLKGDQGGRMKMVADDRKRLENARSAVRDLTSIAEDLAKPGLAQKLDQAGVARFFLEPATGSTGLGGALSDAMNKYIAKNAFEKLDPEVREFITKVIRVRNDYVRVQAGLAQTGGEAARMFSAIIQPQDNASAITSKISSILPNQLNTLREMSDSYALPEPMIEGILQDVQKASLFVPVPFASMEEAEAANLPNGQRITINGRPATYRK